MNLTEEQINEIAEDLETGMRVFIHVDTKEIETIIDWEMNPDFDEAVWGDVIDKIESNPDKYVEFEKMTPNEAFAVMEEFVETVEDEELRKELELGLSVSSPFKNFKEIIDSDGGEYRQKWFEFRHQSNVDWVKTQLKHFNQHEE